MDDEHLERVELFVHLRPAMLERVDAVLLAVAGRLWEVARDTMPQGQSAAKTTWPVKEMRTSPLGRRLLLIADFASGGISDPAQVERAMKQVLRTLYGDPLREGYTVSEHFHKTDLGQLFDQAERRIQGREGVMTPAEVYRELSISRTTLYNRVARKQLHPVYSSTGEMLLRRSEVEEWKAQRQRRKSSS